MKTSVAACSLAAFVLVMLVFGVAPLAAENPPVNGPTPNPYLASPLYAITHFDSSQSDSTPYGPPRGFFSVDPATQPIVYGGPVNIMTFASTQKSYMWGVGGDRVSYVYKYDGRWTSVATYQALEEAGNSAVPPISLPPIPDDTFRIFGDSSAVGMTVGTMDTYLKSLFGDNYPSRYGNGVYVLVDKDNVLYTNYLDTLYGFALKNPARPSDGITARYKLVGVVEAFEGANPPSYARLFGLSMTYDGHLIVTFSNGVGVIDRDLNSSSISFYPFGDNEYVSNSIAVDENNGIYVATGWNFVAGALPVASNMRKLVWTGTSISDNASDGAWISPYDNSGTNLPPIIKFGDGTGSTPTLMGFGDDPDKLVVITDGAEQMNLVAFWRNVVSKGSSQIADQIPVTCGFTSPLPTWIQSEQSVVVYGYGAFVVNNIPENVCTTDNIQTQNKILQVSLMGPGGVPGCLYPTSLGAERFQWNPSTHTWSSVWARSDVSSTSMVPIHSQSGNMALINGWGSSGWEVLGLDWDTGETVHQTIFGDMNFGNGAYAILQYLEDQDLVFNSIVGPFRVHYGRGCR